MRTFIANFGVGNSLWRLCSDSSVALTYDDDDETWPLWLTGDREGYVAYTTQHKTNQRGDSLTKPVASRWFNLLSEVRDSAGDLWIHREKDELWWTVTTQEPARFERIPTPWPRPRTPFIRVVQKTTEPWRNTSRKGVRLLWSGIHPKARQFLFTEGTLQEPAPDHAEYARALLDDGDLGPWHRRVRWAASAAKAGHGEVRSFNDWERVAVRMARTAEDVARASLAEPKLKLPKVKKFEFGTTQELADYLVSLLDMQGYVCALSGLPLQVDNDFDDNELRASLDRIDSDGHYTRGNLQVVCLFINRWKSNSDNASFQRLLRMIRGQPPLDAHDQEPNV